jgi:hypothetical protein
MPDDAAGSPRRLIALGFIKNAGPVKTGRRFCCLAHCYGEPEKTA